MERYIFQQRIRMQRKLKRMKQSFKGRFGEEMTQGGKDKELWWFDFC